MAQYLTPTASAAIDYKKSPVSEPPATNFPSPTDGSSSSSNKSRGSNAALHIGDAKQDEEEGNAQVVDRPTLLPKFGTEIAQPVAPTTLHSLKLHHSAAANPSDNARGHFSFRMSSDSSDQEASPTRPNFSRLRKFSTMPDRNPLSKSELNRVHRHPRHRGFTLGNEHFQSSGRVASDGRLNISVNETASTGYLAKALGTTLEHHLKPHFKQAQQAAQQAKIDFNQAKSKIQIPRLNIVIMVIGSRGDIQPFLKIGRILRDKYHHRVRIATHPTFKKFVQDEIGLEFFSIGGDPSELMAFMVKNPGLIPSLETVRAGEVGRRREAMYQMFQGFWRACINATDDEADAANLEMMGTKSPFVADAIIANPPSFAHYHCAERLSIPLHLVFTFPYSPTQAFPHPLANVKASNVDQSYTNFMSYPLVDLMTWQGLGDLINKFRTQTLGLDPVSTLWAPGQLSRLKVPTTYLWSPGLVPKPSDWGPEIDIAGYVFLDLASSYEPPEDLLKFLERTDDRPMVYIGFGSIAGIDDPVAFTKIILEGVAKANVRAVISRGWGGMGDGLEKPDGVFMVDNIPHDWLFPKVDAVVHHGGAGTTAAGLRYGKPTLIIPFFGDQPFWSAMVVNAGAGAREALPLKTLDSEKFAQGILQCLEPAAKANAEAIARDIAEEGDGAENAVDSFHRALDLDALRCSVFPDRIAVWNVRHTNTKLSALAADILVANKHLRWSDLRLRKFRQWTDFQGPGEPITGAGGVIVNAFLEAFHGLSDMHEHTKQDIARYERRRRKHKGKSIADAVVLPGRIAYASRGTSIEEQRKEQGRLRRSLNLEGEAEPPKFPFAHSPTEDTEDVPVGFVSGLSRTATSSSNDPHVFTAVLRDIGRGMGRSGKAIIQMPFRMWTAAALGFHNAPKLYGDKTVRPAPQRITGFRRGIEAAGTELYFGVYDGLTGIVRLPYLGVQEEGISGLPKGMARGFGGLVLKPISGVLGLGAYTVEGTYNSLRRRVRDTEKTDRWIRRARIAQGQQDIQSLKDEERAQSALDNPVHTQDVDSVREHALRKWTTYEKDLVSEGREKEERKRLWRQEARQQMAATKPARVRTR